MSSFNEVVEGAGHAVLAQSEGSSGKGIEYIESPENFTIVKFM
jgi:hypothetical protein